MTSHLSSLHKNIWAGWPRVSICCFCVVGVLPPCECFHKAQPPPLLDPPPSSMEEPHLRDSLVWEFLSPMAPSSLLGAMHPVYVGGGAIRPSSSCTPNPSWDRVWLLCFGRALGAGMSWKLSAQAKWEGVKALAGIHHLLPM